MATVWSPLRAAVLTFAFVVVVGTVISVAVTFETARATGKGFELGVQAGTIIGVLGAVAAAVAYLVRARTLSTPHAHAPITLPHGATLLALHQHERRGELTYARTDGAPHLAASDETDATRHAHATTAS